jgi:hypothetical protein
MFFYGVDATKKPTAAPLGADDTYRSPFLCPQEENYPRTFFRMSRSAFSFATSRLSRAISSCSGFICPLPGKACCGSPRELLHPIAQLRRVAVLSRKLRAMPAVARIFDGEKEAKLIALACSKPPKGRARWTLRLLENKVVELGIVDRASDSTIGRALKKTPFSPIAGSTGSSHRRPTARS